MAELNLNKVEFIKSAASAKDFIRNQMPRIAFAGRSNVGKSSTINRLLNRKNFARVGSQPGKTVHVNYFLVDGRAYFVDLPGYGFAAVAKSEKERWGRLMEDFFAEPEQLSAGVLIVDARHKPTGDDVTMAQWFKDTGRPLIVAANKADKLKASEKEPSVALIRQTLSLDAETPVVLLSAEKGSGRTELLSEIFRNL